MTLTKTEKTRSDSKRGEKETFASDKQWHLFSPVSVTWYILIALSLFISFILYPNILVVPKDYRLGDVADRDIKATQEFLVEDMELTEKGREDADKGVLYVYDFDQTAANVTSQIKEAFNAGRKFSSATKDSSVPSPEEAPLREGVMVVARDAFQSRFFDILDISTEEGVFETLADNRFATNVESELIQLVSQVLAKGVVSNKMMLMTQSGKGIMLHRIHRELESIESDLSRFYDLKEARQFIEGQKESIAERLGSPALVEASIQLAAALIKPNLTFNKRETELRKDLARKSVKPFYFKIKKGEMIVREGERIVAEHLLKLAEQQKILKQHKPLVRIPAMAVLIFSLLSALHLLGFIEGRSSNHNRKDLLFYIMMLLGIFLVIIACNFVAREFARGFNFFSNRALIFAVPVASGAMLISIFRGMGVAAGFTVIISILASWVMGGEVEIFIYFFIGSLVAAYGVDHCRERVGFIKAGLKVGLCNVALALSIEALSGSFTPLGGLVAGVSAFAGGVFVAIIVTGLLPVIEMSFGYTTDIKLLELANLDQPLLRELMVQAPGTYHHSVIVSNMVEACAKAVHANPLLARVAAYYHDIGKTKKPLYFIENQLDRENKHEKLAPSMSSLILTSHVKDGAEMARKNKLGKEIIDIVQQHHGTSLISFFYEKAREQAEKKGDKGVSVKEEDFRYPGPKPQTKEAGLVMLADVVEAASKTLVEPTVARIQGMVQKMVNKIFSDGQLDECELTLKDLHEIAKSFNMTLSGIFHHRIEYPESVAKSVVQKKGENGDTDQLSEKDSRLKKQDDKAETDESLKRLGLS